MADNTDEGTSGGTGLLRSTGAAELATRKRTPPAPSAPTDAAGSTDASVELVAVTDPASSTYGAIEYGYTVGTETEPGHWQNGTVFSSLMPGTDYTFYARFSGNEYYEASAPSATGLTVTTLPAITTGEMDDATVGEAYSHILNASAAIGKTVTWGLAEGSALPEGLMLSSEGAITGTPGVAVTDYTFTVRATIPGGAGGTDRISNTKKLSITVNPGTLETPVNLRWSDSHTGTAVWDPVTNATGYFVQLYRGGVKVGDPVLVAGGTSCDLGDAIDSAGSYTFTVTATLAPDTSSNNSAESAQSTALNYYAITVNGAAHGSATATDASGNPVAFAPSGAMITLGASPEAGYHVSGWTVDAGGVAVSGSSFTMGNENVEVTPVFEACSGGSASYFQKAEYAVCGREYGSLLTDGTAPEGEITIGANHWTSFMDATTFDLFFEDAQTVEISATDDSYDHAGYSEDHAAAVAYYLHTGDGALTKSDLDEVTFTPYTASLLLEPTARYVVYVRLTDHAGNVTYISSDGVVVDDEKPTTPVVDAGAYPSGTWTTGDVASTLSGSSALSGIAAYQYSTDDGASWTDLATLDGNASLYVSAASTDANGTTYLFRAVSRSGVAGVESDPVVVKIDKTTPIIAVSGNTTGNLSADTVRIEPQAGVSGVVRVTVAKDSGATVDITDGYRNGYAVRENGTYTFTVTNARASPLPALSPMPTSRMPARAATSRRAATGVRRFRRRAMATSLFSGAC